MAEIKIISFGLSVRMYENIPAGYGNSRRTPGTYSKTERPEKNGTGRKGAAADQIMPMKFFRMRRPAAPLFSG